MTQARKIYKVRPFRTGKTADAFSPDAAYEIARSPVAAARRLLDLAKLDRNSIFMIKAYSYLPKSDPEKRTRFMVFHVRPKIFELHSDEILLRGKDINDRELIGFYEVCDDYTIETPAITHHITDRRELM
jgi:hypothetical protein